ncbi:hypothetical protein [Streptomyces sp. NBC_01006]|uniref:hypothetical protein n=1 Tax=Streptomyces sp. NBC_01006 TaxID=2903716 RepID=UPI00386E390A|nr:hypothetical protein OG509_03110 [Streptomyces sp. NBC_01006]
MLSFGLAGLQTRPRSLGIVAFIACVGLAEVRRISVDKTWMWRQVVDTCRMACDKDPMGSAGLLV